MTDKYKTFSQQSMNIRQRYLDLQVQVDFQRRQTDYGHQPPNVYALSRRSLNTHNLRLLI